MIVKEPTTYFEREQFSENRIKDKNEINIPHEKLKLEFSLQNAKSGCSYYITALSFDIIESVYISEDRVSGANGKVIFNKFCIIDYYFAKEQIIQITVFKDTQTTFETTLGCIVGSRDSTFEKKYDQNEVLVVKAVKIGKNDEFLDIKYSLKVNGKDSIYFMNDNNKLIYTITSKNHKLYSSESISNKGEFQGIKIPISLLQPFFIVSFYDNSYQFIGNINKRVDQIENNNNNKEEISLSPTIKLYLYDNSRKIENYTFMDYISSGVRIALSIGIDFTSSNGNPLNEGSLHSLNGPTPSAYERAIRACGNIVGYYDYDQLFPVFGFGAIINSSTVKTPSMCFNLNFKENPDIYTIENIIKCYRDCISGNKLTFSGPNKFTPLINTVISRIEKDKFEYHILMILTNGVIEDMQETIDALVEGSFLPLSVIIIGIGNADFKKMEILDGDNVPLVSSKNVKRMRDLVQFVPFNKFENDENKLTMEVLEEIPRQIVDYYTDNDFSPNDVKEQLSRNNCN